MGKQIPKIFGFESKRENFRGSYNQRDLKSGILNISRLHSGESGWHRELSPHNKQPTEIQCRSSSLKNLWGTRKGVIYASRSSSQRGSIHGRTSLGTKELAGTISLVYPTA